VSVYGLDDRVIEVRSPAGAMDFSSFLVSRPALGPTQPPVQWVPGVLSPGVKSGRGVTLTTHPHQVPRSRMSRSYTSSPPSASMACSGTALLFNFQHILNDRLVKEPITYSNTEPETVFKIIHVKLIMHESSGKELSFRSCTYVGHV
jgi:hypothetical protein